MRIQRGGALLLVLLASCGGSAKATPASTARPATTTPSVSATATTVAPTSVASITPSVAPTAAATTTTLPFIPIKDQVAEAVVNHARLEVACFSAPAKCDVSSITASEGPLRANITKGVQSLITEHYVAREDPADPRYNTVSDVVVADDDRSAVVTACAWDPVFIWHVGGAPDGTDILINSVKGSISRRYSILMDDGAWKVSGIEEFSRTKGVNQCGPRL